MITDGPAYDHDAEVALLSACVWSRPARQEAKKHLLPGDFYHPTHEHLYQAMLTLDRTGHAVDPVSLRAAVAGDGLRNLDEVMVAVTTSHGIPESVATYAAIVRSWALRRRVAEAGQRLFQRAMNPAEGPERLTSEAVTMLTALRDHGQDVTAQPLGDLMAEADDAPRWVIPDLLEAGDRLMLTGSEGAGKSALSRQMCIMAAAGLHPFTEGIMPPIKALIVDCENKPAQVRRQTRPLLDWLRENARAATDPSERVLIDTPGRIDVNRDRDLSRLHQTIDAWQPDLVVLGPVYRMAPRALNTDDEAAPFLAALDTITDRGAAVILEAHAGHSTEGVGRQQARSLRPRGSSALMGWPEFGLGLRGLTHGYADLEPWRGGREQRAWPGRIRRAPGRRWVEVRPDEVPPPDFAVPDPQGALV